MHSRFVSYLGLCSTEEDQIHKGATLHVAYPILSIPCLLIFNPLQCHNGHDSVSNHQPHDCLLNRLFRRRSKKTSKLRVTGICAGNSPGTGEFPAQMASNAKNVSIRWRHHANLSPERLSLYWNGPENTWDNGRNTSTCLWYTIKSMTAAGLVILGARALAILPSL